MLISFTFYSAGILRSKVGISHSKSIAHKKQSCQSLDGALVRIYGVASDTSLVSWMKCVQSYSYHASTCPQTHKNTYTHINRHKCVNCFLSQTHQLVLSKFSANIIKKYNNLHQCSEKYENMVENCDVHQKMIN